MALLKGGDGSRSLCGYLESVAMGPIIDDVAGCF